VSHGSGKWIKDQISLVAGGAVLALGVLIGAVVGASDNWHVGEWLGAAGLVISLAGFTVALLEIRKTQTAAIATRRAIDRTLRGVAASRLGIVIVQLRDLADDFEDAATDSNHEQARPILTSWRHAATDAKTLVRRRFGEGHESLVLLDASIKSARDTKSRIFEDGISRDEAKQCLAKMEKALDGLGPLLEELFPASEEDETQDGNKS
jgi:hypothetical protein